MKIVNTLKEAIPVMIEALVRGDLDLVDNLLVKYPRLIELRDKQGRTLLMIVAYLGSPGIVNYFISFHVIAAQYVDDSQLKCLASIQIAISRIYCKNGYIEQTPHNSKIKFSNHYKLGPSESN